MYEAFLKPVEILREVRPPHDEMDHHRTLMDCSINHSHLLQMSIEYVFTFFKYPVHDQKSLSTHMLKEKRVQKHELLQCRRKNEHQST